MYNSIKTIWTCRLHFELGITLDKKIQWGSHIDKLASRIGSTAVAVRNMRLLSDLYISFTFITICLMEFFSGGTPLE